MSGDLAAVVDPSRVDAAWLTSALGGGGVGARIVAVEADFIGTGQVGDNVRFELTWDVDHEELPRSVVGKFPSRSEVSRATAVQLGTYRREIGFYRDVRSTVTIRTPTILHLGWEADTHDFVLLMEDLRDAVQGDQLAGCGIEQAAAAVDEAVGLHAPTWGRTAALRTLDWLGFPDEDRVDAMVGLLRWAAPGFAARFESRLSAADLALGAELTAASRRWTGLVARWAEVEGGWCVTHGDYRLDNLLFGAGSSGPPVIVVDWQTVAVGIGPLDIAYFCGAGLLPEDRERHERELVARYAAGLRAAGVDVSDAAVWEGYAIGSASGYLMAIIASQLVEQTERGDEMFAVMAERHASQIRDVGLLDRL